MDIKVTDLKGDRITFGRAMARYLLKSISAVLFMLGYLISFTDKRQTLHDYGAQTLVLRRRVSPAYYLMPTLPSRWMFEVPGLSTSEHTATLQKYQCAFCGHRENERWLHCQNCGAAVPLGETRLVLGLNLMNGIIFSLIGTVVLVIGASVLSFVLAGETPWPIAALILAFGIVFAVGGVSALFGRNWLTRWLIFIFVRRA
jgi:energy-converting hydrogenase Eha subunit C